MLRHSFVLLAALSAAGPATAAGWADGLFEELSKDFGSVPHGKVMTHAFRITNNTKNQVTISGIRVSCGCVTAQAQTGLLNPGDTTTLTANMDTSRFYGVRTVTVFVQFGAPTFDEVRLTVQANSRSDFAVNPDALAYGQVKRGDNPTATVTISFFGSPGAKVTEVKADSNYIQPTIQEIRREGTETVYQLTAKLRPDTPVGKWFTDVWVKTNIATMAQVRVPLTVEVQSALSVSHEIVDLGTLKAGGEIEKRVVVRGVKPFKIVGVEGGDDELSIKDGSEEAKAVHVLTVKLHPAKTGDMNRSVKVLTDLEGDNRTDFRVTAKVVASD